MRIPYKTNIEGGYYKVGKYADYNNKTVIQEMKKRERFEYNSTKVK